MSFDQHRNFSSSTVLVAPTPASSGTTLTVQSGAGAIFPAVPFNAVVVPFNTIPTPSNAEIVRVTNITGDVFTITRAQESSVAQNIAIGYYIADAITAKDITDIETATQNVDAVTLEGKTWEAPGTIGSTTPNSGVFSALRLTSATTAGYVMGSDASGNASWVSPVTGMTYKGTWNASTNTPTLADGVGTTGDTYAVSVGGVQFTRTFVTGGFAIYNGAIWQPVGTSAAIGANPTANIGFTATNGSAATFMRSDAAPALPQSIILSRIFCHC